MPVLAQPSPACSLLNLLLLSALPPRKTLTTRCVTCTGMHRIHSGSHTRINLVGEKINNDTGAEYRELTALCFALCRILLAVLAVR